MLVQLKQEDLTLRLPVLLSAFLICAATLAASDPISAPEGKVVLTVTGNIERTNDGDALQFDYAMLKALDATIVETSTIWTDGVRKFQGVNLATLVDVVGAKSGAFLVTAINNYTVEIPLSDAVDDGPILAYAIDGKSISVRDKGPLWIIYPYDRDPEYRTEVIYSRSIWQLDRIEVVE